MSPWALIQNLHGIAGALLVAACAHPMILLGADRPVTDRLVISCRLAFLVATICIALAWPTYFGYRAQVRDWMIEHHGSLHTVWFELKEALGWFAWLGAACGAALVEWARDDAVARRGARRLFGLAFASALFAGVVGLIAASVRDLS